MKIKTSELSGIALDWAVARCEETTEKGREDITWMPFLVTHRKYSSDWSQGGPIIEREGIDLLYWGKHAAKWGAWESQPGGWGYIDQVSGEATVGGETPLIAAMRCYVASKLGEEVEVPDDLL